MCACAFVREREGGEEGGIESTVVMSSAGPCTWPVVEGSVGGEPRLVLTWSLKPQDKHASRERAASTTILLLMGPCYSGCWEVRRASAAADAHSPFARKTALVDISKFASREI